jgi:hypothetical protein
MTMSDLLLTSQLSADYHEELESLLFFNSKQAHVLAQIEQAVADFGLPKIVADNGSLRIRLAKLDEAQSLYVLQPATPRPVLVGLLVYYRRSVSEMVVIHMALDEDYLAETGQSGDEVLVEIVRQFREQLKRIRGVETLGFCYTHSRWRVH